MEVGIGSDAFKTDVSCTESLLPCSGVLCKPVTAGGFWVRLTHSHVSLNFPFSAHPFSFLGQHQNTVASLSQLQRVGCPMAALKATLASVPYRMEGAVHG